jgi:hypothetical protein
MLSSPVASAPELQVPAVKESLKEAGIGFWAALNQSSRRTAHVVLRGTCNVPL